MTSDSVFPRMHVSLYVADMQKTVAFYNNFFGKPADKIKPGYAKYILEQPSLIISFVQNPERVRENFGHLGFQVASVAAMKSQLDRIKATGLKTLEEMQTRCCYALQDKFWVNDPDGIEWEIYYFHEDAEFNDPRYEMKETSACCSSNENANTMVNSNKILELPISKATKCCEESSNCC